MGSICGVACGRVPAAAGLFHRERCIAIDSAWACGDIGRSPTGHLGLCRHLCGFPDHRRPARRPLRPAPRVPERAHWLWTVLGPVRPGRLAGDADRRAHPPGLKRRRHGAPGIGVDPRALSGPGEIAGIGTVWCGDRSFRRDCPGSGWSVDRSEHLSSPLARHLPDQPACRHRGVRRRIAAVAGHAKRSARRARSDRRPAVGAGVGLADHAAGRGP
jgi:hypothetical protein